MKKIILISACTVFVVVALIAAIFFVLEYNVPAPATAITDVTGTWTVIASNSNGAVTALENQFMVFERNSASMYKDDLSSPYAQSAYTVGEDGKLKLPDVSREYVIDKRSDNVVLLFENATTNLVLVRTAGKELTVTAATLDNLAGKWDVALKGDQKNNGEVLAFEGSGIKYYKAGSDTPFATADVTVEQGILNAASLNLKMKCYKISDSTIVMAESNGTVWEIHKADK